MATFVKDKTGAFKKHGDQSGLPTNRRSEGRMKSYTSATDARAWVNNVTENKQYIIELIGTDFPKCQQVGKYVPVDVLLKTLMSNKDEDIKKLNYIVAQLEGFINSLKLSCEELKSYHKIRASWGAGDGIAKKHQRRSRNTCLPPAESKYGRTCSEEVRGRRPATIQETPRTSSESRIQTPRSRTPSLCSSMSEAHSNKVVVHSQQSHLKYSRPTLSHEKHSGSFATVNQQKSMQSQPIFNAVAAVGVSMLNERPYIVSLNQESSHKDVQVGYTLDCQDSHTQTIFKAKETVDTAVQYTTEGLALKSKGSSCTLKSRIPVPGASGDVKMKLTQTAVVGTDNAKGGTSHKTCPECEKHLQATRATINELDFMKKALDERNYELQKSELRLKNLQNDMCDKEAIDTDISEIAAQITQLRENSNTDQLLIVSTELDLLKKYCQKLIYIKEDNKRLKQEVENYRSRQLVTHSVDALHRLQVYHQTLVSISSNLPYKKVESMSDTDIRRKLQSKVAILKEVTKQRDKLQADIHKIETKLKKYENLNSELTIFKEKSQVLDRVIEEKLGLERRLTRLAQLESEIDELRVRADKADELQRALENAQKKLLQLQDNRNTSIVMPYAARSEHSRSTIMDELRYKAREAEMLRIERDRMRVRLQELLHIEQEYKLLQSRCRMLEAAKNERDIYKSKNIELVYLQDECASLQTQVDQVRVVTEERDALVKKVKDLEHIIRDKENEINRLVRHIERLSKGAENQQDKIKDVITNLRSEIESKNLVISTSETHLADVQNQLKQTIASLTKEINALKQQVFEADATCVVLKARLERLSRQWTEATVALGKEKKNCSLYKAEVVALNQDNQRLQEIADRMNDLTDTGKIESILQESHNALRDAALKLNQWSTVPTETNLVNSSTNTWPPSTQHAHKSIHTVTGEHKVASIITDIMNIPTRDYDMRDGGSAYQKTLQNLGLISTDLLPNETENGEKQLRNLEEISKTTLDKKISVPSLENRDLHGYDGKTDQSTSLELPKTLDEEICVTNFPLDTQDRGINVDPILCSSKGIQPAISTTFSTKSGISASTTTSTSLIPHYNFVDTATVCFDHTGVQVCEVCGDKNKEQITFRNVAVCRASQIEEDYFYEASPKDDDDKTTSPTKQSIPACLKPDARKDCKNPSCVCKTTQTREPYTEEPSASKTPPLPSSDAPDREDREPDDICGDSSEELIRLQELENQGKLSLTNIRCVCKHTQSPVCKCVDTSSQAGRIPPGRDKNAGVQKTQSKTSTRKDHDVSKTICVDTEEDRIRLRKLQDQRAATLRNITCVCRGAQTEVCECRDKKKKKDSKKIPIYKPSADALTTICVDNEQEQKHLQKLDKEGALSLKDISCLCKGIQAALCECYKLTGQSTTHASTVTFHERTDDVPPCRRDFNDTICVDNKEMLLHLRQLEEQQALSLENITCVCKGAQTVICKCTTSGTSPHKPNLDTNSVHIQCIPYCKKDVASDAICVDTKEGLQKLQQRADAGKRSMKNVQCACKETQTEKICEWVETSTNTPVIKDDTSAATTISKASVESSTRDNVRCMCKAVQHKSSESHMGQTPAPYYSGQPTNTTSGINSESLSNDILSMSKDVDLCDELRDEIKELKRLQDTMEMENQALRKHSIELKEAAKNQIAALSSELQKSREDWAKTDDSKTVIDLQEQNKLLQHQLASQNKLECECKELRDQNNLLLSQVKELETKLCECSQMHEMQKDKLKHDDKMKPQDDTISKVDKFGVLEKESKEISSEMRRKLEQERLLESEISQGAKEKYDKDTHGGAEEQYADKPSTSISATKTKIQSPKDEALADSTAKPVDGAEAQKDQISALAEKKIEPETISRHPGDDNTLRKELGDLQQTKDRNDPDDFLGKQLDNCMDELNDLRNQLAKCREELEIQKKPEAADSDLRKQLEDLKKQLAAVSQEKEIGGLPTKDLKTDDDDLRKQLEALKKQLADTKNELEQERTIPKGDAPDMNELLKQLEDLKKKLQDANKRLEDCEDHLAGEMKKLEDAKKELDTAKKNWDAEKKQLTDAKQVADVPKKSSATQAVVPTKDAHAQEPIKAPTGVEGTTKGITETTVKTGDAAKTGVVGKSEVDSKPQTTVPTKGPAETTAQTADNAKTGVVSKSEADSKPQTTVSTKGPAATTAQTADNAKTGVVSKSEADSKPQATVSTKGPAETTAQTADNAKTGVVSKSEADSKTQPTGLTQGPTAGETADVTKVVSQGRDMGEKSKGDKAKVDTDKPKGVDTQKPSTIADYQTRLAQSEQQIDKQKQQLKESASKLADIENELERTKQQSIETIRSARASFERDIVSMQEKYLDGIESMQAAHEDLMSQGNAALEAEIDSLRKESIEKQTKIDELSCMCYEQKKKKVNLCQVQVQAVDIEMECVCDDMLFAYLLRKVLYCGLESLTFEDLQYMHTKICNATAKVMGHVKKGNYAFPPCKYDYKTRQSQAQTQVARLQMEVALERQRLESLKKALDIERTTQAMMEHNFKIKAQFAQFPCSSPMPAYISHQNRNKSTRTTTRKTAVVDPFVPCKCASSQELNHRSLEMDLQEHLSSTILHH